MNKPKTFNDYALFYKSQLENKDLKIAYEKLLKYLGTIRVHFKKKLGGTYTSGNLSPGYMDFSYFPFTNSFLNECQLRFGIVINHHKLRFELWLMGRNAEIQSKWWNSLKNTEWNKDQTCMPKYSVLECVLIENPDFDRPDKLTTSIIDKARLFSDQIIDYIKEVLCKTYQCTC